MISLNDNLVQKYYTCVYMYVTHMHFEYPMNRIDQERRNNY